MTDLSDDEALAAEYALGTLDEAERSAARTRSRTDNAFAALIAAWEARLAPLDAAAADVAPPPVLLARVMAHLDGQRPPAANDNAQAVHRQLRVWRAIAVAATALAAVLAIWIVQKDVLGPGAAGQTYVAVLQKGADTPAFMVSLDMATKRMTVVPLATNAPAGHSYELWMIGPDQAAPRSMGVIDAQRSQRPQTPDVDTSVLAQATYAVTMEPLGGSPTGQPTSAPVFVGKLVNTAL